jgi:hypothetical protein
MLDEGDDSRELAWRHVSCSVDIRLQLSIMDIRVHTAMPFEIAIQTIPSS